MESQTHRQEGCASCDEVQYFKMDLMKVVRDTQDKDILGRAEGVCRCIDDYVAHVARMVNQERYWPNKLDEMRKNQEYDHVLLKSDYWKSLREPS